MSDASKSKKIAILIDWALKPGWAFFEELSAMGNEYDVIGTDIPTKYGSKIQKAILVWSRYMTMSLKALRQHQHYDIIIAYQSVIGLNYALLRYFLHKKNPKLILMGFFFVQRRNRLNAWIRFRLTKLALAQVDKVICYSREEVDHYNQLFGSENDKFTFVPYGININKIKAVGFDPVEQVASDYIFSGGSSNRDYSVLFQAVQSAKVPIKVVAKKYNVNGLPCPANVELFFDIDWVKFTDIMLKAKFLVIPLLDRNVSSGQLVLLEAMCSGKAVIIARTWGTIDYVRDGHNALFYQPNDANDLRDKITFLLSHDSEIERLGQNARQTVLKEFNAQNFAKNVNEIISTINTE